MEDRRALVRQRPEAADKRYALAQSLTFLGTLEGKTGRSDEALAASREAVDVLRALVEDYPSVTSYLNGHASATFVLASALVGNEECHALAAAAEASALRIMNADPTDIEAQYLLGTIRTGQAAMMLQMGRFTEGEERLNRAIEDLEEFLSSEGGPRKLRLLYVDALKNKIALATQRGHIESTREIARHALELIEVDLQASPDDKRLLGAWLELSVHIATADAMGEPSAAAEVDSADSWVRRFPASVETHLAAASFLAQRGAVAEDADRESLFRRSVELLDRARGLGFVRPARWPGPDSELQALRGRPDFEHLLTTD